MLDPGPSLSEGASVTRKDSAAFEEGLKRTSTSSPIIEKDHPWLDILVLEQNCLLDMLTLYVLSERLSVSKSLDVLAARKKKSRRDVNSATPLFTLRMS